MSLNFKETSERKVYFTSDTHLGHKQPFVWEARGYASADDHTNQIIDTINNIVQPNDILFHLGDFCLNTTYTEFESYISRIQCQNMYYVWGNHNSRISTAYENVLKQHLGTLYEEGSEFYPLRYRNIVYVGNYREVIVNGQFIVLSHYPIYVWNYMAKAAWMLCGHSHYGCPFSMATNKDQKILDVGWDGYKKPLSFSDIKSIMDVKGFVSLDNHHK